jgi:hypothetical protein
MNLWKILHFYNSNKKNSIKIMTKLKQLSNLSKIYHQFK